ncbi:hypothetical protein BX589_10142 [Paraburkholderia fungorum]|jgi:hypothetical protein|nr:hypothetical protein BX589_10142 [Paraburkholderia fungorum]
MSVESATAAFRDSVAQLRAQMAGFAAQDARDDSEGLDSLLPPGDASEQDELDEPRDLDAVDWAAGVAAFDDLTPTERKELLYRQDLLKASLMKANARLLGHFVEIRDLPLIGRVGILRLLPYQSQVERNTAGSLASAGDLLSALPDWARVSLGEKSYTQATLDKLLNAVGGILSFTLAFDEQGRAMALRANVESMGEAGGDFAALAAPPQIQAPKNPTRGAAR